MPQHALLRACFARCGGGMRQPGGGASCLGVGRPGSGALPTPTTRPFGRAAGAHYALAVGAGDTGVGTRHQSHRARSCKLALRSGGGMRVPGGERLLPGCGASRVGRSPTPDNSSFWGVRPGPTTHWLWVRGVWAWGPVTNPTARALASWRCALWGRQKGARGGRLLPGRWASGVGRSPTPDNSSFRACARGPLPTGCGRGGCGRGDPSPTPQGALLQAGFARCGSGTRAPRGGRLLPGCGASGVGRSPDPDHSSFRACGRGPLPTGCGCGGCGRRDPSPTPQHALLRAGFARCGGGMRVPGEGASCLGVGRPGSGALPPPTIRPFRRAAGAHYPLLMGAGGAGVGTRHQPQSAGSCELALPPVGAARGRPGGGVSCLDLGRPGSGALPPPTARPLRRAAGAHYPLTVAAGGRAWGPITNPTARSCVLAWRALGAAQGRPGGAPLAWVWGVRGHSFSPPTTFPFERAAGAHYPLAVGAGGAGVGTRHQPHIEHSCELALRVVGVV